MAYSHNLRERIVEAAEEGQKHAEVALRFKVGVATVRRYLSRSRSGELAAKTPPRRNATIMPEAYDLLREQVRQHNDATLAKHCELWEEQQGVKVSVVANSDAQLLASKGCSLLFLPPYSPNLNLIEKALSKIKTFVKKCQARTRVALDQAFAAALKTISLQDILGWFAHSGYNLRYQ